MTLNKYIKTRKILTMTGYFIKNSDIDKLYVDRKSGSRGLGSIKIMFESRLVALRQHLTHSKNRDEIIVFMNQKQTIS